jgi:hypothetical protein
MLVAADRILHARFDPVENVAAVGCCDGADTLNPGIEDQSLRCLARLIHQRGNPPQNEEDRKENDRGSSKERRNPTARYLPQVTASSMGLAHPFSPAILPPGLMRAAAGLTRASRTI